MHPLSRLCNIAFSRNLTTLETFRGPKIVTWDIIDYLYYGFIICNTLLARGGRKPEYTEETHTGMGRMCKLRKETGLTQPRTFMQPGNCY